MLVLLSIVTHGGRRREVKPLLSHLPKSVLAGKAILTVIWSLSHKRRPKYHSKGDGGLPLEVQIARLNSSSFTTAQFVDLLVPQFPQL